MITTQLLTFIGVLPQNASRIAEPLKAACALFDISTKEEVAGLVGQCAVETIMFSALVESLNYSTLEVLTRTFSRVRALPPTEQVKYLHNAQGLANLVYSNRYGNGDVASNDGWNYRGRGCIQTTFRANYEVAQKLTGRPYIDHPELLETPSDAALSAAAYFVDKGAKVFANKQNWDGVTKSVNPAMLEAKKRALLSSKALEYLNKTP